MLQRRLSLIVVLLFACSALAETSSDTLIPSVQTSHWNEQQEQRLQHLLGQLKCIVCQGQSLRQSDATLAQDIRASIKESIVNQQSDDAILSGLVQRYGQQILFAPPLSPATLGLWALPLLILIFALGLFYRQHLVRLKQHKGGYGDVD